MLNYYERNVGHELTKQKEAPFINKRYEHAPHLHVPSHGEKVWPCSADSGQHTNHTIARPPSYGPLERILTDQLGEGGGKSPLQTTAHALFSLWPIGHRCVRSTAKSDPCSGACYPTKFTFSLPNTKNLGKP